ncbi:MAB_1171c family putative transporter [Streptomyces sp. NPDC051051]|uniref:MAB_1171c family putative transporter n=1 Tax=Streptomyces sp. NPDC051051 TaxID=3155666 RepID=UPI00342D7C81
MNGLPHYVSAAVLWLGLLVRAPDLLRHRHDPYLRSICAVLGLAGLCFLLGAPPTVGAVNRLGATPNLAAPLTYAAITGYSAASQVLIVHWRGGPRVRRTARRWILAYTLVVLGIVTMFVLGDAPVERRVDLDTYYANTPFLREMIVLYLLGHLAAVGVTTVSALRWARDVRGWLRAGLVTLGFGSLCGVVYSLARLTAVAARWTGHDWSALVTDASPAAAGLGAVMTVVGVLVPLAGPRLTEWRRTRRTYARLEPLEHELDGVLTRHALRLPRPCWARPATRLVWRRTSIHNALTHLDAYVDRELYDATLRAALRRTGDAERAAATAWATVIAAAVRQEAHAGPDGGDRGAGESAWFLERAPDPAALVRIADALAGEPLVRGAVPEAVADRVPGAVPEFAPEAVTGAVAGAVANAGPVAAERRPTA